MNTGRRSEGVHVVPRCKFKSVAKDNAEEFNVIILFVLSSCHNGSCKTIAGPGIFQATKLQAELLKNTESVVLKYIKND